MARKLERQTLVYHLRVMNRNTHRLVGYLENITTRGVLLFSPTSVRPDKVFPLEILLPAEMDGNDRIAFDATSVWCLKDVKIDLYAAGFRIHRIGRRDAKQIARAIQEWGSRPYASAAQTA